MSVNLATKYETKLDERFKHGSFTDKWVGNNYNWDGVNTIKVWTLLTDELNDYSVGSGTSRFGTPTEVDDEVNTYTLSKKRSFAKTFDECNVQDTMFIRKANTYLKQMWDERYIPEIDKYRLARWANGAGTTKLGSALTKSTVITELRLAFETLDNLNVPSENRVIFMPPRTVTLFMLSDEMKYQQGFVSDGVVKGHVNNFSNAPIIQVPESRMPAGCEFLVKYKSASADPMKLRMLRANTDVPGVAGTLMEGLCRYDSFVLANKMEGIYGYFKSACCTMPTITISSHSCTISAGTGETIKYTVDGSNPKTSETASTYSEAITTTSGAKVRAYASKTGLTDSGISEAVD